ncbi:ParA family protein [Lacticaseibacillus brantae]|uniref:Chromosome partitioning ATPase n=1 Tax=Lacticaseibacillus brantae DSM 23927 TaxID=1423727 RepID=A0A0R2B0B9_9LACO|nr:ParA family protein [Lacticaseibacillus brantae]KRM72226.1 chromosome partitioning ATPase [Lacticaseibacillus brantae DSM 23927]
MKAKVISFINMKGGVGKTTLSIGIADYLSNDLDKKTLFIDMDPQFNGTQAMFDFFKKDETAKIIQKNSSRKGGKRITLDEAKKAILDSEHNYYNDKVKVEHKTVYKLFTPQVELGQAYTSPNTEGLITKLTDNLDIIAGDLNLVLVNRSSDYSLVKRLQNFLLDNDNALDYDYIIIDCPPTLTTYTDGALLASDYYVIPNRIDRYSINGIDSLEEAIGNLVRQERLKLRNLGIIYTMVQTDLPKRYEAIKVNFESKKVVNAMDVFTAEMHYYSDIQVGKTGGTLPSRYQRSKEDIEAIAIELLQRIQSIEESENE